MKSSEADRAPRGRAWPGAVAGLAGVLALAWLYRCTSRPSQDDVDAALTSASAASTPVGSEPRCREVSPGQSFVIGPEQTAKEAPAAPADGVDSDHAPDRDDLLSPFAVIVGRAAPHAGGFAVGILGDAEGGGVNFLTTIAADGASGKTVKLLRSRPDLDPPVVAPLPGDGGILVAMLQPNASSRAIRIARVRGEEIAWGPEIPEDIDESLAIDIASNASRGVVAWDTMKDDRASVHVAGFALDSFGQAASVRLATTAEQDADSPRVVAAGRGFYLAYLVHGRETVREAVADRGKDAPQPATSTASKARGKKGGGGAGKDEVDEARGGESVSSSWIEVMLLDETGAQSSEAIRVSADGSTVVSFDVAAGPADTLIVAYRNDDAPTGGGGGLVHLANVRAAGVGASYESPDPLPSDGVPSILAGWLGVPTLSGPDLLARLGPDGMPAEPPEKEPSLGRGEPIAASELRLLLAEPEGRAMRFRVVECKAERAGPAR